MTDTAIQQPADDGGTVDNEAPEVDDSTDAPDQPEPQDDSTPEPPDDSNQSGREKLYRLQAREAQSSLAMVSDKLRAAQRQLIEHHIAGRIRDPEPFWQHNKLHDLLNEGSDPDYGRVDQAASDLVTAKPYLAVPTYAAVPNDDGKIGFPSVGAVNQRYEADPAGGWHEVLRAAVEGG